MPTVLQRSRVYSLSRDKQEKAATRGGGGGVEKHEAPWIKTQVEWSWEMKSAPQKGKKAIQQEKQETRRSFLDKLKKMGKVF